MPNPRTPSPEDGLRAVLERELEQRRGRAPEPGEIFVLPETAVLPVEWALLEPRPKAFLAIPVDTKPLAGSQDFALGPHVLSGPLSLRCGHAVEIAIARLRPELRTGLLDPHSLAAARSLQTALAQGIAAADPMGEEVDRDPEYRDWVEEVLDPARAVMVGLGEALAPDGAEVVQLGNWRERQAENASRRGGTGAAGWVRRASPWLAAALLAVSLGLSWQKVSHLERQLGEPGIDEPTVRFESGVVRGEKEVEMPPDDRRVRFSGEVPAGISGPMSLVLVGRGDRVVVHTPVIERHELEDWSLTLPSGTLSPGLFTLEFRGPDGTTLADWTIRVVEPAGKA